MRAVPFSSNQMPKRSYTHCSISAISDIDVKRTSLSLRPASGAGIFVPVSFERMSAISNSGTSGAEPETAVITLFANLYGLAVAAITVTLLSPELAS